ncbi:MAG: prepilin peptidase [Acidimicrobiales bacterium]|jgi:leader peptidase (prepilin peptidase) / N-methyltransferase
MIGIFVVAGTLIGLTVGSFSNVVVYRTPRHLSVVRPGSFCPTCRTEIESRDNVPVFAWLWLRGKCRHCGTPISARYPIVEAGVAVLFIVLAATIRPLWGVPGWWLLTLSIAWVAIIELDYQSSPVGVPLIETVIGIAAMAIGAFSVGRVGPLDDSLAGFGTATALALLLTALIQVRPNIGLTAGAIWCLPAWGACLGWLGLVPALTGLAVGLVCTAATTRSHISRFAHIPIATCAAAGLIAAVLTASLRA